MTYYVDNGAGYRRAFSNIVDARKAAVLILEAAVADKRWSAINTTSYGVPIYTGAKQTMDKATRFVNYYNWSKKEQGFEYIEWDYRVGTKHIPMYKNGKLKR